MKNSEKIVIMDFGSQYTQLIARRLRELGVYTDIISPDIPWNKISKNLPKGIILSGGPGSTSESTYGFDQTILQSTLPILGICFGMQLMNSLNKGVVKRMKHGEYGKQKISICSPSALFHNLGDFETVWMSHGDSLQSVASCYHVIGKSQDGIVAAIQHQSLPHYGLQFHPEVTHTSKGDVMLSNFIDICNCTRNWTIENYIESVKEEIRQQVGEGQIVSLISGGVDSTASTLLCFEAIGKEKVFPIHIDNGLMRLNESDHVKKMLTDHGISNLAFVDASQEFLNALKGVTDPEKKRSIIGTLFIEIMEREIKKIDKPGKTTYFCQGTLYTDLIESGKGCGKHAAVIKTHHNVNPPIVEKKRSQGLIVEPNKQIFKDEVRKVCKSLNVPDHLVWRHPFPGPGLAIRIIGDVTKERLDLLRKADQIFLDEIQNAGIYNQIWQAFAILIPVNTVGVMGDQRTQGHVICLRAVSSTDGMTADFSEIPFELLGRVGARIINEVPGINRVVYDITSKPPGTIEWE